MKENQKDLMIKKGYKPTPLLQAMMNNKSHDDDLFTNNK